MASFVVRTPQFTASGNVYIYILQYTEMMKSDCLHFLWLFILHFSWVGPGNSAYHRKGTYNFHIISNIFTVVYYLYTHSLSRTMFITFTTNKKPQENLL